MRILISNIDVTGRTGTEMYVRDLSQAFHMRGHEVEIFTSNRGPLADEIEAFGVSVRTELRELSLPDIIHAQHTYESLALAAHFPGVPMVYVGHDATALFDHPLRLTQIQRYIPVDDSVRERFVERLGISEDRVTVVPNLIDFSRFRERGPLPAHPQRVLLWSNYAGPSEARCAREFCQERGMEFHAVGRHFGNLQANPGDLPAQYDVVIAKGRCALESAAAGAAVIYGDAAGCGGMFQSKRFLENGGRMAGRKWLTEAFQPSALRRAMDNYDPEDAAQVSRIVRRTYGEANVVAQLLQIYTQALGGTTQSGVGETLADELAWWAKNWQHETQQAEAANQLFSSKSIGGGVEPEPTEESFAQSLPRMGWHEREADAEGFYCWTGPETKAYLNLKLPPGESLQVFGEVAHFLIRENLDHMMVRLNGRPLAHQIIEEGTSFSFVADLVTEALFEPEETVRLCIEVPEIRSPKSVHAESTDGRLLGLAFRRIGIRSVTR
jgi:hypothetical protein